VSYYFLMSVTNSVLQYARGFTSVSQFYPGLIFAGMAGAYLCCFKSRLLVLPKSVIHGVTMKNPPAYYNTELISAVKSYTVLAQGFSQLLRQKQNAPTFN
jgi:hypothetical protein